MKHILAVVLCLVTTTAWGQEVLSPETGLRWETPWPSYGTCSGECCTVDPSAQIHLRWRLQGNAYSGNLHVVDALYPPIWIRTTGECTGMVESVYPARWYDIQGGTVVVFAVWGANASGESDAHSNEVTRTWPWICDCTTRDCFRDCVMSCYAAMGVDWCSL
jgi:hypothetical protein